MDISRLRAKTCTKCGEIKPLTSYSTDKKNKTGLRSRCNQCLHSDTRERAERYKEARASGLHLVKHKLCRSCGETKDSSQFHCDSKLRDGLQTICKQCCLVRDREYYRDNTTKVLAIRNKTVKKYPHKRNARSAKRRAGKLQATPIWADLELINSLYLEAQLLSESTGVAHHADHIVPLNHPLVCGLHVETNLQVLTGEENVRKSNKFLPG